MTGFCAEVTAEGCRGPRGRWFLPGGSCGASLKYAGRSPPCPLGAGPVGMLLEGESATAAREGGRVVGPGVSRLGRGASWRAPPCRGGRPAGSWSARKGRVMPCTKSKDALGRAAFFHQHLLDDLAGLRLREAALAQEVVPVLIRPRPTICCRAALMPFTNPCGEELANRVQRRGRLMGEAGGGVFRMPDPDLLKILDAPQIPVLTHRPAGRSSPCRASWPPPLSSSSRSPGSRDQGSHSAACPPSIGFCDHRPGTGRHRGPRHKAWPVSRLISTSGL